jgi:hypothetical protein
MSEGIEQGAKTDKLGKLMILNSGGMVAQLRFVWHPPPPARVQVWWWPLTLFRASYSEPNAARHHQTHLQPHKDMASIRDAAGKWRHKSGQGL